MRWVGGISVLLMSFGPATSDPVRAKSQLRIVQQNCTDCAVRSTACTSHCLNDAAQPLCLKKCLDEQAACQKTCR
jgi:hypothetical protein